MPLLGGAALLFRDCELCKEGFERLGSFGTS
jgi:hypothetical protein